MTHIIRVEKHATWRWGFGRSPRGFEFTLWLDLGPLCLVFDPHWHE